jgi:hypothetical protein
VEKWGRRERRGGRGGGEGGQRLGAQAEELGQKGAPRHRVHIFAFKLAHAREISRGSFALPLGSSSLHVPHSVKGCTRVLC